MIFDELVFMILQMELPECRCWAANWRNEATNGITQLTSDMGKTHLGTKGLLQIMPCILDNLENGIDDQIGLVLLDKVPALIGEDVSAAR